MKFSNFKRAQWAYLLALVPAIAILAAVLAVVSVRFSTTPATREPHRGHAIKRHLRHTAPGSGARDPTVLALTTICRRAIRDLEAKGEATAPKVMRGLLDELGRVHPSARWRARIERYRRALRQELPVERTVALVAATGERYPADKLIQVREAKLAPAAAKLHVGECSSEPL